MWRSVGPFNFTHHGAVNDMHPMLEEDDSSCEIGCWTVRHVCSTLERNRLSIIPPFLRATKRGGIFPPRPHTYSLYWSPRWQWGGGEGRGTRGSLEAVFSTAIYFKRETCSVSRSLTWQTRIWHSVENWTSTLPVSTPCSLIENTTTLIMPTANPYKHPLLPGFCSSGLPFIQ